LGFYEVFAKWRDSGYNILLGIGKHYDSKLMNVSLIALDN